MARVMLEASDINPDDEVHSMLLGVINAAFAINSLMIMRGAGGRSEEEITEDIRQSTRAIVAGLYNKLDAMSYTIARKEIPSAFSEAFKDGNSETATD